MNKEEKDNLPKKYQNNLDLSVFKENKTLSFIHKKSQKMSSAIHLVTSHLSDKEPVKWRIRLESINFVKDILSIIDDNSRFNSKLGNLKISLLRIESYLNIISESGFMSSNNADIFRQEIANISQLFDTKSDFENLSSRVINDNYFHVIEEVLGNNQDKNFNDESNLTIKDNHKGHYLEKDMSFKKMSFKNKKDISYKGQENSQNSKRIDKILDIIKDKKKVSVKDISSSVKDFSEKTIQRDLISLVKKGVLKKEGERRWSKYMLS